MKLKIHFIWQVIKGYAKLRISFKPIGLYAHNPFGYCKLI